MKKFAFILAALAMVGVACNKQESIDNTPDSSDDPAVEMIRLELKVSVDPETRASMVGKALTFGVNDEIAILATVNNTTEIKYLTVESIDSGTGVITFTTTIAADAEIGEYAYYPSDLIVPNGDDIDPTRILWPSMIYTSEGVRLPMMAKIDLEHNTAVFKHLGAMLKVTVTDAPTYDWLEFKTSTNFSGYYTVNPSDWSISLITNNPPAEPVNYEYIQSLGNDTYYIPVPAGSYADFQLGMMQADNMGWPSTYIKQRTANLASAIAPTRGQIVNLGNFEYDVDEIAEWYINGYSTGWKKNKDTRYIKVDNDSYKLVAYAQQDGYRIYDGSLNEYVGATAGAWSGALAAYQNNDAVIPFTENSLFYAKLDKINNTWQFDNTERISGWDWCWSSSYTVEFHSSIDSWGDGVKLSKYNYNNNMCWSCDVTIPSNDVFYFKFKTKEGNDGTEQWHGKNNLSIVDSKPYGSAEKGDAGNDITIQLTPGQYKLYLDLHEYNFMFVKQS